MGSTYCAFASITRDIAGCFRFFTLIQFFDRRAERTKLLATGAFKPDNVRA
jgi:hypothetical protein